MKFKTLSLLSVLASSPLFASEQPVEKLIHAEPVESSQPSATANTDISISHNGNTFHPVQTQNQAQMSGQYQKPLISKGLKVKSLKGNRMGTLTGYILVKTHKQAKPLPIDSLSQRVVGDQFVLVSFSGQTDLQQALSQIRDLQQVESAEIEVNTNSLKPH